MTECSTEFLFNHLPHKPVCVDFAGGELTSDAGLLLFRQADQSLGLLQGFAECIPEWRTPHLIRHSLLDQVRQRVYQLCAGYEDADDCDTLRGDCGFSLPELLQACERLGVHSVFGIAGNAVLKRKSESLLEQSRLHFLQKGDKARLYDDVYYQTQSWSVPRRVVMKCEWQEKGGNRRFVVTDSLENPQVLYDEVYVQRGEACENRIKDLRRIVCRIMGS